jgi:hypothetical protein
MAGDPDPYEVTLNVIEARLGTMESGAPAAAEDGAWTQDELDTAISELKADHETLRQHWRLVTRVVVPGEPTNCAACGEPRDCSTARAMFAKYGG